MRPTTGANSGRAIFRRDLPESFRARYWAKVIKGHGCWAWGGTVNDHDYGQIRLGKTRLLAHRVAVAMDRGFVAMGAVVDHLCNHPRCVNPRHLRVTTQRENWLRGRSPTAVVVRTGMCRAGRHSMDNAYVHGVGRGRACRYCTVARARAWRWAHRDAVNARARAKYRRLRADGVAP